MTNTHEDTHVIDAQDQNMENTGVEQEKIYEDTDNYLITEEELGYINP